VRQSVSEPTTGLTASSSYHYRLCAKDQDPTAGANCTPDQTFATRCTAGTTGCGWRIGDLVTFDQGEWGAATSSPAAQILTDNYFNVYPFGVIELGIAGLSGNSMSFTGAADVIAYLPESGPPGPLTSDLLNPLTSSSGSFGAEILALKLNVDFTARGLTGGTSGVGLGTLTLCNFPTLPALNGMTMRQFFGIVNTLLGNGATSPRQPVNISQAAPVTASLNTSFLLGTPSTFAQEHLVNGTCP
jgi:hypothetical protein